MWKEREERRGIVTREPGGGKGWPGEKQNVMERDSKGSTIAPRPLKRAPVRTEPRRS